MHHVYFLAICLLWGSNFILMSRASSAFGPLDIGLYRLMGAGIVLAMLWWFSGHGPIARRHWPHIALVALLGNAFPFTLQPILISLGFGHSYFGMTISFVPLLTVALSVPMLGLWPSWRQLVGVLGGLVAIVTLMWDGQERGMSALILGLAVIVPLVYATSNCYIRRFLCDIPPIPLTAAFYLIGSVMLSTVYLIPFSTRESLGLVGPAEPTGTAWAIAEVAWLAIVGTGLCGYWFVNLIHVKGPLFAGMVAYLVPVVALCWGIYDNEPITFRQIAAMLVILAMVALVQFESKRTRQSALANR